MLPSPGPLCLLGAPKYHSLSALGVAHVNRSFLALFLGFAMLLFSPLLSAGELALREQELKTKLKIGYAVRLDDMNKDGRPDICIVDKDRIIWLENPNWEEHTLIGEGQTKLDNVCFAQADIDGDGLPDFAVGADWNPANTKSGGTIQWITRGKTPGEKWSVHPIGEEPTVHRMRFADLDGDGKQELIVAPLLGKDTTRPNFQENGVRILSYQIPKDPVKGPWTPEVLSDEMHVTHNFIPVDMNGDKQLEMLVVSFEGVNLLEREKGGKWQRTLIGKGNQETSPNRGASEIKLGKLAGGKKYIATIEPWHGSQVVVYTEPDSKEPGSYRKMWTRHVVDGDLEWGHAVWCANLDGDDDEELIIGIRDDKKPDGKAPPSRRGLRVYDPTGDSPTKWKAHRIDPGGVAIEDLAAADLNADGRIDIVAVGRQTNNVKVYWNETK